MSSLNSNNDFEELDDPFGASGLPSDDLSADNPFGSETGAPEEEAVDFAPAAEDGAENPEFAVDGDNPDAASDDAVVPESEEAPVQYKKVHCWDLYSWLLFIAWLALLGGILILWLECPPSEYGDPPYKEGSVPVKTATP